MDNLMNLIPGEIKQICREIRQNCMFARPLLVGGAVIDLLEGRVPKDWDIEVLGEDFGQLETALTDRAPKLVGKCFGVMKLSAEKCEGLDVDINVPRRDNKVSEGHTGFAVELCPDLPAKEAARRRDFTINTMAFDVLTGELIDEWGGLADLRAGVLRATDPVLFPQDPLRALRAMQLFARKMPEGSIDPATVSLIRAMVPALDELPQERKKEEFSKLLGKAKNPSVGLRVMRETGVLAHFPELEALIGCDQHPEWHPEGDVWIHSLHTVDSAAWVRDNGNLPEDWVEPFMFGTLLHDVGKPLTTVFPEDVKAGRFPKERLWTAWAHDTKGVAPGTAFMKRLTNERKLIDRTTAIIREHMQPFNLHQGGGKGGAWKRLHNRLRLDVLGWMCRCDHCGGPAKNIGDPDLEHEFSEHCWSRFTDLGAEPVKAVLMGRHLIEAGVKPGEHFTPMLQAAFDAQLDDESLTEEELLAAALSHESSPLREGTGG